eukprot:3851936-Pyramimonas_sp.AAC.1
MALSSRDPNMFETVDHQVERVPLGDPILTTGKQHGPRAPSTAQHAASLFYNNPPGTAAFAKRVSSL